MTSLKEQAVRMLQDVPDDKMTYVIDILKCLNDLFTDKSTNSTNIITDVSSEVLDAWEGFKKYKGIIHEDIDEKEELKKARDEKYADFD